MNYIKSLRSSEAMHGYMVSRGDNFVISIDANILYGHCEQEQKKEAGPKI